MGVEVTCEHVRHYKTGYNQVEALTGTPTPRQHMLSTCLSLHLRCTHHSNSNQQGATRTALLGKQITSGPIGKP